MPERFLPTSLNQAENGGGGNRTRGQSPQKRLNRDVYSYVYFVQDGTDGPIKIGLADNPEQRLSSLQVGNPRPLTLLATFQTWEPRKDEAQIHARFAEHRIRGEWFHPHPDLMAQVVALQELEWRHIDALIAISSASGEAA